jgi:ribosomal protein S18 acetylase RimI-like enzyme
MSEGSPAGFDTMAAGEAQRSHTNMVEAFASLPAHQEQGFVRRRDGLVVAVTGSPVALFNTVLPVGDMVAPEAAVEAVSEIRQLGLGLYVQLREGVDDHLALVLGDVGLEEVPDASWPAMAMTEFPAAGRQPEGLEIRKVVDRTGLEDHLGATGGDPEITRTWLGEGLVGDPDWALFVGYSDDVPVARSMAFVDDGAVGVYNVGTRPEFRRRGFGWALTEAALVFGVEAGCSMATLQSSAMGLSMYRAHGFRHLFRYRALRG